MALRVRAPRIARDGNADGVGTAAGSATASAVSASLRDAAGSAAGSASVSAVTATLSDAVGSAAGSASATAFSLSDATGSSAGAATVSGVGATLRDATGSAAGAATVSGASPVADGAGSSAGAATVSGGGASLADATGTISGSATAQAETFRLLPIPPPPVPSGIGQSTPTTGNTLIPPPRLSGNQSTDIASIHSWMGDLYRTFSLEQNVQGTQILLIEALAEAERTIQALEKRLNEAVAEINNLKQLF